MTYADGIAEGFKRGWVAGYRDGWRKAMLFFLKKQVLRHDADNATTRRDIEKLEAMGVRIAREPRADEWIEVESDPLEL